jgi:hypothetical protein
MEAVVADKRRRVEPDTQEPPHSVDLICSLSNEMLEIIISFLPTKSVVQTTVLY